MISPFILSNLAILRKNGTFPYWVKLEYIFHQFLVLPFFEFLFANWFFLHVSLILPLYKHLANICRHVAKIAFAFGIFRIPFRVHSIDLIWQGYPRNITGNISSHWKKTGHPKLNCCAQIKSQTEIKKLIFANLILLTKNNLNRSFVFFRIGKTGYLITPKSSIVLFVINGILGAGLGLTVTSVTACGALGDGISTPQCSLIRILPSGVGYCQYRIGRIQFFLARCWIFDFKIFLSE